MKKLILSILFTLLFIHTVNGETISLSYDVSPTYTIVLPTQIDISENNTSFLISVSGDIYYDSYLQISIDDSYITSNNKTYPVYINQDQTQFTSDQLSKGTSSTVYINHENLTAGKYTGSLNINIVLKENN